MSITNQDGAELELPEADSRALSLGCLPHHQMGLLPPPVHSHTFNGAASVDRCHATCKDYAPLGAIMILRASITLV